MRESLYKYWKLQCLCTSLSLSLFVSVFVFVFLFVHIQLQSLLRRSQIKDGAQAVALTRLRSLWVCEECVCVFVCDCVWCRFSHFRHLLKILMMICYFCAWPQPASSVHSSQSNIPKLIQRWQRCADRRQTHSHSLSHSYSHDSHSQALTLSPQA